VNGVVEIREVTTADNISDVFSKIVTGLEFVNESLYASRNSSGIEIENSICVLYILYMIWNFQRGGTLLCLSPNLCLLADQRLIQAVLKHLSWSDFLR
jgi:hypothetical protein